MRPPGRTEHEPTLFAFPPYVGGADSDGDCALTPRTDLRVRGRGRTWVRIWVATFAVLYAAVLAMTGLRWADGGLCLRSWWCATRMYACTFGAALAWVFYLWRTTTRPGEVPPGLLVSVWLTSGTLSVGLCSVCNWAMVQVWAWLDPLCYITYPADHWPWEHTSGRCTATNLVQWVLTAGLIEEGFKFVTLLRLRPTPLKVRAGLRWGPALPGAPKIWWMRLADSPLAVALCGVAAGGGLATSENFMYIFSQESIDKAFNDDDLEAAYGRIAASFAHMVWTGYAACGIARWQFMQPGDPQRPRRKSSNLLAPIILHGLYNWCSTMQRCEAHEETYGGQVYRTDGCYASPSWRVAFKVAHAVVMLWSFYIWHAEFSDIAGDDMSSDVGSSPSVASSGTP